MPEKEFAIKANRTEAWSHQEHATNDSNLAIVKIVARMQNRKSSRDDYIDEDQIFNQSYHNIISAFSKMKNQIKPPGLPEIVMASSQDRNEVYIELAWN